MIFKIFVVTTTLVTSLIILSSPAWSDPCGMVPPVYIGEGSPIVRVGEQQTYVFYKNGVETFVIRPGFSGKMDEFGMLIPFPSPPAIRKVPDYIFSHIAAAIDPPEVVINLIKPYEMAMRMSNGGGGLSWKGKGGSKVRVLRREAVGMYEVAVLEAGSAHALERWMDQHGYRYPDGMDKVCNDYVDDGWCFVAVKTKVGPKHGIDPKPGQRTVNDRLPAGSNFDGAVQAMGFRFRSDQLVVPMRLSAFNDGELRNIVYLLTDGPRRIRLIPEEYVVRQIQGEQLYRNVTDLLPLRIIGLQTETIRGGPAVRNGVRIGDYAQLRHPDPKNGAAKALFASDLLATHSGELSLPVEEQESQLLAIGEYFQLRGAEIDKVNAEALKADRQEIVLQSLKQLKQMTLTVVDGDFPRDVLANKNLTFAEFRMPRQRNNSWTYDAKTKGPVPRNKPAIRTGRLESNATGAVFAESRRFTARMVVAFSVVLMGAFLLRFSKPIDRFDEEPRLIA